MRDPVASLRFCAYVLLNFSRLFVSVIPTVRSRGVVLPIDSFSRESRAGPENGPFLRKVMIENLQMRASMATMEGKTSELTLGRENDRIVISHLSRRVSQFILCTRWRINTCYSML